MISWIVSPKKDVKQITVSFVIVSFLLSILSISLSHYFLSCLPASCLCILLFALCMLFARLHNVDSFRLNAKTGEIEASSNPESSKVRE
jgi:hypothetical protein